MKQSELYGEAIKEDFDSKFIEVTGRPKEEFESYCNENVFFVTMHVQRDFLNDVGTAEKVLKNAFYPWYRDINKKVLGNNIDRKVKHQPRGWAFADFNGTRRGGGGYTMLNSGNPHVHAIMMLMPGHAAEYRTTLMSSMMYRTPVIASVRVDPFRLHVNEKTGDVLRCADTLQYLGSYAAKALDRIPDDYAGKEDTWMILPPRGSREAVATEPDKRPQDETRANSES